MEAPVTRNVLSTVVEGTKLTFDPPVSVWEAFAQAQRFEREGKYVRNSETGELVKP